MPPPRRQTTPLATIRAASAVNDQLTAAQVRQNAGVQGSAEDLVNVLASQLRRALGAQSWLYPPATSEGGAGARDIRVRQELLSGIRDGANMVFTMARAANPSTVEVGLNGQMLPYGECFIVTESSVGQGFDAIILRLPRAPRDLDRVTASYDPA